MHTLGQKFGLYFYTIPDLCWCGCGNILYIRGQHYLHGHDRKNVNLSATTKLRMSSAAYGRHRSQESKDKQSTTLKEKYQHIKSPMYGRFGINNPRFNTHHTEIAKQKISDALKGKYVGEKSSRFGIASNTHPNWQGGISFLPYCQKWTNKLRETIRKRDNYTCQLCDIKQTELIGRFKKLSVHHVHYDKENCYPDLITLCLSCNSYVNFNRKHYESLFMSQLNDRGLLFWTLSLYKEKTV